jgi:hypothetical protein
MLQLVRGSFAAQQEVDSSGADWPVRERCNTRECAWKVSDRSERWLVW